MTIILLNKYLSMGLEFYFIFIVVFFLIRFSTKSQLVFMQTLRMLFLGILCYITYLLELTYVHYLFIGSLAVFFIHTIFLTSHEFRNFLDGSNKDLIGHRTSQDSKEAIADAVLYLASQKIGALITIEKHRSLDQYSKNAVTLNSDISKELLINIFSPLTPLHDGAVIIRGDKINCAAAYYILSRNETLGKTVGSRHRAALGIAEVTDSVTIVVSEETGKISIAYGGIFMVMNNKEQLLEYIDLAMQKGD